MAAVPLGRLAHQSLLAGGGLAAFPFTLAYGVVGFVVAWRKPGNALGWLLLGGAASWLLSGEREFLYAWLTTGAQRRAAARLGGGAGLSPAGPQHRACSG